MPEINEYYDYKKLNRLMNPQKNILSNENDFAKKALALAEKFHKGQTRWDGSPYIGHPIAVANILKNKLNDLLDTYNVDIYLSIAYLHDTFEDTEISITDLFANGIPQLVIDNVLILTKDDNESYLDYILRIKKNNFAKIVKLADLEHNLSTSDPKKNKGIRDKWMLARYILLESL